MRCTFPKAPQFQLVQVAKGGAGWSVVAVVPPRQTVLSVTFRESGSELSFDRRVCRAGSAPA